MTSIAGADRGRGADARMAEKNAAPGEKSARQADWGTPQAEKSTPQPAKGTPQAEKNAVPPELSHLRRLSRVRSMAGVAPLTPAVSPGNHCPMHTALSLAARTKGVSTLVIGTPECAYYSRNVPPAPRARAGEHCGPGLPGGPGARAERGDPPETDAPALHWTYVLDAQEVVFGCREGVAEAVLEMDGHGVGAILLISTCVPEVNGEDVASLCDELQPRVRARLMHVELGNYTCGGYEPGNRKTLMALGALVERAEATDGSVNVLGREPGDDHSPLPELLAHLEGRGVRLRLIGRSSDVRDYARAGRARANLVVSPFFDELADRMERELGIPAVRLHSAYGADEVLAAYRQVGEMIGLDVAGAFADAFERTRAAQERVRRRLAARAAPVRYVSARTGAVQPLPLVWYLTSLGMVPLMVHMEDFSPGDRAWKRRLVSAGADPLVCNMLNAEKDRSVAELLKPDLVLDDRPGAVPTVRVSDLYGRVGLERTDALLARLETGLDAAASESARQDLAPPESPRRPAAKGRDDHGTL